MLMPLRAANRVDRQDRESYCGTDLQVNDGMVNGARMQEIMPPLRVKDFFNNPQLY